MNSIWVLLASAVFVMDFSSSAISAKMATNTEAMLIQQQQTIQALQSQIDVLTSTFLAQQELYQHVDKEMKTLLALTKQILPKTCEGLKELGLTENGEYLIDPDGPFAGSAPIFVDCDFETGTTIVHHDQREPFVVEHCCEPGCSNRTVSYEAPDIQLRSLMTSSESCTQRVEYNCYSAPLSENFSDLAWWTGESGEPQTYWAGYNPTRHVCKCGLEENCVSNLDCNCDAKYPQWFQDAGNIVGSELPIREFFFGGLIFEDQQANFTLGPLECKGKAPSKRAESCTQVRMNGAISSGFYWVHLPTDDSYKLTHCDLTYGANDFEAQQDTGILLAEP